MTNTFGDAPALPLAPKAEVFTVWPRTTSTAAALVALVGLQALLLFAVTQRSFFTADDYYHFKLAQERSLLHYVATPIVHTYPAPGHRLLFFVLHQLFPLNYVAARCVLLSLLAATTVLLGQFVRMLARSDEWWTVALLVPFALSLAFVGVVDWWSAGVPVIPALFFTTIALSAWLRSYTNSKPARWLAVTVMATAAAGGFYLKFLLIPFYLLFLRLVIFPRLLGLPRGIGHLWQERRRWMAVAAFPALFVAVYVLSGLAGRSYVPGDRPYLRYLATAWFEVFIPVSFLNVPLEPSTPVTTSWAVVVCSQVAFWSVAWVTWRRTSLALYGWALLLFVFAVNMLMVGTVRLPMYGVAIAYPLRYYPEILLFVPVALALSLRQGAERRAEVAWERTTLGRTAMAGIACLYALSLGIQAPGIAGASDGVRTRRWFDNLRRDVRTVSVDRGVVRLMDSEVPEYVIPSWLTPDNRVSTILKLLQVNAVYNELSGPAYLVRSDGRVARATFRPLSLLFPPTRREGIGSADAARSRDMCVHDTETLLLRPDAEPGVERLALRAFYSRESRGSLTLEVQTADPDLLRYRELRPERGAELVDLATSRVRGLKLQGTTGTLVCFERMEIGSLTWQQSRGSVE